MTYDSWKLQTPPEYESAPEDEREPEGEPMGTLDPIAAERLEDALAAWRALLDRRGHFGRVGQYLACFYRHLQWVAAHEV